jgi:hypothetical protein
MDLRKIKQDNIDSIKTKKQAKKFGGMKMMDIGIGSILTNH